MKENKAEKIFVSEDEGSVWNLTEKIQRYLESLGIDTYNEQVVVHVSVWKLE